MSKKIVMGKVLENKEIAKHIYLMTIQASEVAADACPGQFVNVYLKDKSLLLPRPISICNVGTETLTLVYKIVGKGTTELAAYLSGDLIRISTSLGNGFQIESLFDEKENELERKDKVIALVGGGVGVPPLVGLASAIRRKQKTIKLMAVLGFQEDPFLVSELNEICDKVYLATDNGTTGFHGTVVELIEEAGIEADFCFACGPKPMLKALAFHCEKSSTPLQVSMEERMGCGYGACVGCTCKTKQTTDFNTQIVSKKVCKDGPVFLSSEVVWDE